MLLALDNTTYWYNIVLTHCEDFILSLQSIAYITYAQLYYIRVGIKVVGLALWNTAHADCKLPAQILADPKQIKQQNI